MNLNTRALLKVGLLAACWLTFGSTAKAQCDNTTEPDFNYQYPVTLAAPAIGNTTAIAADNWPGEYSQISGITAGFEYTFTMSGGGFITVHEGSANGPVLGFGTSPVTITAAAGTNLFPHWNIDAACGVATFDNRATDITTLGPSGACTGTPTPGNTISSVAGSCGAGTFTLSLQNFTNGSGVSYQWQVSTVGAGGPWTDVGTDAPTYVASQSQESWYQCVVTCDGNDGTSTPVNVIVNPVSECYCTTVNFTSNVEPICLVQFADINNSSPSALGSGGNLEDFTAIVGNINAGQTYPITLSGNTDGNFTTFFTVFFDFDQDGLFETNFPIGSITNTDCALNATGNITIPSGAPGGTSRMRVVKNFNASPLDPCGTYGFGQAEDYTVSVTPSAACNAQPTPGATLSSAASVCAGATINFSLEFPPTEGGISYQWQVSTASATGPWTDVGTDAPTYSASQTQQSWYQCVVTCAGNGDGISTAVQVDMSPSYACYCSDNLYAFADPCITNVTFGVDLNNNSAPTCALPSYTNYFNGGAGTTGTFTQGVTYPFTFTASAAVIASLWIDWDASGTFDVSEHYQPTINGTTATINIEVPFTSQVGLTGLRVRTRLPGNQNGAADACTQGFGSGEGEDYVITIEAGSACSGTPTPGATESTVATACASVPFTLSLENATTGSGVSYQWQVSTVGAGGPWTDVGPNADTYSTSLTETSWYQCVVTCDGNDGTSTPVQVTLNAPANCFCAPTFTANIEPICLVQFAGINNSSPSALGSGGELEDYTAIVGNVLQGETYPITLSGNTDGNFTTFFTVFFDFDQNGVFDTNFPIGSINNTNCTVNVSGNITIPLGATLGNTRMRVVKNFNASPADPCGTYGFGQAEDYTVNVGLAPTCSAPSGITAVATSTTTATISWNAVGNATDYDVEVRQGGLPGTGGEVYANTVVGISDVANGLTLGQSYQVYVRTDCGLVDGESVWSAATNLLVDYCAADAVVGVNDPVISNFTYAGINNANGSNSGYLNFTAQVASAAPGVAQPVSITRSTNFTLDSIAIWIDLNNDLDFNDAGEAVFNSSISPANPTTGNITIPNGTLPGDKRMRVRRFNQTPGFNYSSACGTAPFGQTHDYTVNVCASPAATATMVDDCGNGTFSVDVNITDAAGGTLSIAYSINGAAQTPVAGALGSNVLDNGGAGFAAGSEVSVTVTNGSPCELPLGSFFSNCPVEVICGATLNQTHCYTNGDTRTFTYTNPTPGESLVLTFNSGSVDGIDVVRIYDGVDNFGTLLYGGPVAALVSATSTPTGSGTALFMEIDSDGSGSCFDGDQSVWNWEVECFTGCVDPDGLVTVVNTSCVPPTFELSVEITSTGDAATTTLSYTVDGGAATTVAGLEAGNIEPIGPFALGANVEVILLHQGTPPDGTCNRNLGTYTAPNNCPPANDDCSGTIALTIQPPGGCPGGGTIGTTVNATYSTSLPAPTCGVAGTSPVLRDVWYSFNTGLVGGPIYVNYQALTATGQSLQFYTGNCGALVAAGCLAAGTAQLTGPPANTTYYIRVISNSTTGVPGTFRLCVTGSTCQGANIATAPTVTNITPLQAQYNFTTFATTGLGNYIVEYGPSATFTTPGVGGTAGPNGTIVTTTVSAGTLGSAILSCLNPSTPYRVFVRKDCGGGNYSVNGTLAGTVFTTQAAYPASTPITPATCAQAAAIPDNGCATPANTLNRTIAVAGETGTLGVDLALQSVDLIITHTWRSDLNIRLQSPTGCVRNLVLARGGSNDNYGNNATCPAGLFTIQDGGAALTTIPLANDVVGVYAPEEALSGFTGTPNGNWTIRICDAFGGDTGALQYVRLNFGDCVGPTATRTVVPDCANNQFSISVNVTNLGSAGSYTITNNINGSTVPVPAVGAYSVGPFASGSNVTLTLVHSVNTDCNLALAPLAYTCPPANDACESAVVLTPGATCVPTPGNNLNATQSVAPSTCTGFTSSAALDVWYQFVATRTTHRITVAGAAGFDAIVELRTGVCNGTAGVPPTCVDATVGGQTEVLNVNGLSIGTTYLVRVYAWAGGTGSFTICVEAPDCLGVYGGPAIPGASCSDGNPNTALDAYNSNCVCAGVACTTDLELEINTDANPGQNTWELRQEGTGQLAQSGGGLLPPGCVGCFDPTCLPNGTFYLRVFDSGGDGIVNGGYTLRVAGANGARLIDNRRDSQGIGGFTGGSESTVAGNLGFSIPVSNDRMVFTSCDKLDWTAGQYIVANDNPAVNAQWGTGDQTDDGYVFWFYNPNGGYSFRRFRSHATTDGFPATGPTRACHTKINNWAAANHIPANVFMNVKVRSRVNGVNGNWGPACRFMVDPVRAACPLTKLMDIPDNQYFSCGVTKNWGGSNRVHAKPVLGATQYQFRFYQQDLPVPISVTRTTTTYYANLNWTPALPNGIYNVEVRAFKNGQWCITTQPWGDVCTVTIQGSPATAGGGSQNMPLVNTIGNAAELTMFPNPNRGDLLTLGLSAVEEGVETVTVDIFDATGKRVIARTIAVQDGYVSQVFDLNEMSAGLYMVNVTAGTQQYNERLVIQR